MWINQPCHQKTLKSCFELKKCKHPINQRGTHDWMTMTKLFLIDSWYSPHLGTVGRSTLLRCRCMVRWSPHHLCTPSCSASTRTWCPGRTGKPLARMKTYPTIPSCCYFRLLWSLESMTTRNCRSLRLECTRSHPGSCTPGCQRWCSEGHPIPYRYLSLLTTRNGFIFSLLFIG